MKRREAVLATVGALLLTLSAWAIRRNEPPHRDSFVAGGGCRTPVTILEPRSRNLGAAVLVHGLSANRRIMQSLGSYLAVERGLRVYLVDLPGHGDNTDSFSFPRAEKCARAAVESLIRTGEIDPGRTIVAGHSMGGAIAIRMADREPVAATIAISPAPMPLPQRMPANLLVFSAQYDLPTLGRAAQTIEKAAGGERTKTDDFLQAPLFTWRSLPSRTTRACFLTRAFFGRQVIGARTRWRALTAKSSVSTNGTTKSDGNPNRLGLPRTPACSCC